MSISHKLFALISFFKAFNAALAQCARQESFHFLDVWDSFADDTGPRAGLITGDGIHPTDLGYQVLGKRVMAEIGELNN